MTDRSPLHTTGGRFRDAWLSDEPAWAPPEVPGPASDPRHPDPVRDDPRRDPAEPGPVPGTDPIERPTDPDAPGRGVHDDDGPIPEPNEPA